MQERYVVPVAVGASPRFGENRSSKRAQSVVIALGGAMALCLLVCRAAARAALACDKPAVAGTDMR